MASGTKHDPWVLKTPICQVGSTTLRYHLRVIDDLHAVTPS